MSPSTAAATTPSGPSSRNCCATSGIYDYSIFLDEETLHLFAVLKLRDGNTREQLPQHPVMRRWWEYMRELMETQADGRPIEWPLVPLFHLD